MAKTNTKRPKPRTPSVPDVKSIYVLPPRQGRQSLLGIESAFASLRAQHSQFSFEIYGEDGLISYLARAQKYPALDGIMAACYPQAQLTDPHEYMSDCPRPSDDWLHLQPDEALYVLPMHLQLDPYLPLRYYTDQSLTRGETDPLASVLGYLSTASADGRRLGSRLLIHPAKSKWANAYQRQIQQRNDRQDLAPTPQPASRSSSRPSEENAADLIPGVPNGLLMGLICAIPVGYLGYKLYTDDMIGYLIALLVGVPLLAGAGYYGYRKLFRSETVRSYFDEEMAAAKIGSQGFHVELQLLCVMPECLGKAPATDLLEGLAAVYSQFDNQAGNAWLPGKTRQVKSPTLPPSARRRRPITDLGPPPVDKRRMKHTILSPRELGTIWHLPLGEEEAALMRRAGSRQLRTYLKGLDRGAMVGEAMGSKLPVRISDEVLRRHILLLGKSGMGKSTLATHIIQGKIRDKAAGIDNDAMVVLDPHADLVREILNMIPPELADKVRLIDLGNRQRIPAINLLDPDLHKSRDRCASVVIETLRPLWENWGPRMQDIMDCCLKAIYEYNDHADTSREEMLTMLDILPLLSFENPPAQNGRRPSGPAMLSEFQKKVLQRVSDPALLMRFDRYARWSEQLRNDAFAPVETRISGFASDEDPRAVMGQWETTIDFGEVIREGQILLVNTARGTVGRYVSSLIGSTTISLIDAALREQESLDQKERQNCLIIADEFHSITGTNWEDLLAEIRKFGGRVLLITQGLTRLDTDTRKLKAGVLSNCGGIVCYQLSGEDADSVVEQMGRDFGLTETDLVSLDPYSAYLKLTVGQVSLPPFSIRTRPPEAGSGAALHAIASGMMEYTRDRAEVLQRIALRMQANGGDGLGLRIEDPPRAASAKGRPVARGHSALPPDVVAQVLAGMNDDATALAVPSPQVDETSAGPAQDHPPTQPSRRASKPRDPNSVFRGGGRPRKGR